MVYSTDFTSWGSYANIFLEHMSVLVATESPLVGPQRVPMPKVFISYSRDDATTVHRLIQALAADGITVWRDVDSLHGGQQWPKIIGEAIADNDLLLLVWSQHAAASHFVDLEWNAAVALRKTLLPCVLDATPLPPALSAVNAIDARQFTAAVPKIQEALHQFVPATVAAHDTDESAISHRRRPAQSWLKRWYMWVTLLATLLSVLTMLVDLPGKIGDLFPHSAPEIQRSVPEGRTLQTLAGVIWDDNRETVAEVEVFLPEFNVTTFTDRQGKFVPGSFSFRTWGCRAGANELKGFVPHGVLLARHASHEPKPALHKKLGYFADSMVNRNY
jgi:TIR domain